MFERYLNSELSETEKQTFEKRLQTDPSFHEEFEMYKEMMNYLDERVKNDKQLQSLNAVRKAESSHVKSWKWIWIICALLVLAFCIFYGTRQYHQNKKFDRMMAEYVFPPNESVRSVESASSKLDSAIWYFDIRDFEKSERLFLEILQEDSLNQQANRYMGHIMFAREKFDKSLFHFNNIETNDSISSRTKRLIIEFLN